MHATIDSRALSDRFQPAIDFDNREATEDNGPIWLGPWLALAAVWLCKYVFHGSIAWIWGVPYCKF